MDKSLSPRDIAKIKDTVLKKLSKDGSPQTIDELLAVAPLSPLILVKLIQEEPQYFTYTSDKFIATTLPLSPATVSITEEGKYFYRHTNGFTGVVDVEEKLKAKEKRKRNFDILYAIILVVFTGLAAYGSINNKLWENKEERLEGEISNLKNLLDKEGIKNSLLIKRLDAIPDSIKDLYIK